MAGVSARPSVRAMVGTKPVLLMSSPPSNGLVGVCAPVPRSSSRRSPSAFEGSGPPVTTGGHRAHNRAIGAFQLTLETPQAGGGVPRSDRLGGPGVRRALARYRAGPGGEGGGFPGGGGGGEPGGGGACGAGGRGPGATGGDAYP